MNLALLPFNEIDPSPPERCTRCGREIAASHVLDELNLIYCGGFCRAIAKERARRAPQCLCEETAAYMMSRSEIEDLHAMAMERRWRQEFYDPE